MNSCYVHVPKTAGTSICNAFGLNHRAHRQREKLMAWDGQGHITSWHRNAREVKQIIGDKPFLYTFIRDPYDRAVSMYEYFRQKGDIKCNSFEEYCDNLIRVDKMHSRAKLPQMYWLKGVEFDFVGKFEALEKDLKELSAIIGVDLKEIPHLNPSKRKDTDSYYNDKTRKIITNYYKEDFDNLGYETK